MSESLQGKRVAVVGSGISGLGAAWLLHRNGAAVTLYEREASCGGHTLTDCSSGYPVDLGFQVYNLTTYPNLVAFLDALGVDTQPSDMSFALSMDGGKLEWASHDLDAVFAQRKNMTSPSFLLMLRDVLRFGREAPKVLEPAMAHVYRDMTLGQYLKVQKYSHGFVYNYVLPMCAAVWSVPNAQVMQFPVQTLIRFWVNHHLLDVLERPLWRVVKGRSREYVQKVCAELPDVRTSCGVARIDRPASGSGPVIVTTEAGDAEQFDAVVLATHSDVSLRLLGEGATDLEREVLGAIPYNDNTVLLHSDASLMPHSRKAWASWNLISSSGAGDSAPVCVTYWVNRLQELPPGAPNLFVTLNPLHEPAEDKVHRRLTLAHPVFSFASDAAQARVPELQGQRNTFFAGAWCSYGFHEDGLKSAVAAVKAMGGSIPWEKTMRSVSPKKGWWDSLYLSLFDKFASATFKKGFARLILPDGRELQYGDLASASLPVAKGEEWRGRPAPCATLRIFDFAFFRKVVTRHDTGLGESYMDGDWEGDVGALMAVLLANVEATEQQRGYLGPANWLGDKLLWRAHTHRANTREGSRKNIEEHYDAGNDMYRLFLDSSMMYSSAIHSPGQSLYDAQMAKLDAVIAAAELQATDHVLEIGCGWGGFALRAAQTTGCRVTGLTLSKEQLAEATQRVKQAGLQDRIHLMYCDYRDCPGAGTYDKVVSIEMIEAVGHEHLVPYFRVIGEMLKPGGKAVLQAISVPDERYEAYCRCSDFIREHIFPGGHLVCVGAMVEAARGTGLSLQCTTDIGPHYAVTLREWRQQWEDKKEDALALGYSERFWRKYRFYFAYCEAAFDARYLHNFHLTWTKSLAPAEASVAQGAHQRLARSGAHVAGAVAAGAQAIRSVVEEEIPSDTPTQALLALYFFLAGLLLKGHPWMWLLPAVTCACALAHAALQKASYAFLPFYRLLSPEQQAWWSADVAHLAFSVSVSAASIAHAASDPWALLPWNQVPPSRTTGLDSAPCALACASAGFFAFHLWLSVRYRLYSRGMQPIVHFTLLLLLFVVAAYKGISLALLSATLMGEMSSVPFLIGKLQHLAGMRSETHRVARLTIQLETFALVASMLVHGVITLLALASPSSFGNATYYTVAVLGLAYCNSVHWHRAWHLRRLQAGQQLGQGQRGVPVAGLDSGKVAPEGQRAVVPSRSDLVVAVAARSGTKQE